MRTWVLGRSAAFWEGIDMGAGAFGGVGVREEQADKVAASAMRTSLSIPEHTSVFGEPKPLWGIFFGGLLPWAVV